MRIPFQRVASLMAVACLAFHLGACAQGEEQQSDASVEPMATQAATPAAGREAATHQKPGAAATPREQADSSALAKRLFAIKCSGCHGANGGGGMGPSLVGAEALGHEAIVERIQVGSPTRGMPAFGSSLKPNELDALVRYVEKL